jgi:type I restriction enzyme M protein
MQKTRDEYKARNVFLRTRNSTLETLHARAKLPTIGTDLDNALEAIEQENPELRNVLSKVYGKPNLDKTSFENSLT